MEKWIVFMDLDGSVWDNKNISAAVLPFKRTSQDSISDLTGRETHLLPGSREFLKWVKEQNGLLCSLTWNIPERAIKALHAFQMLDLFDFHRISITPRKDLGIESMISELNGKGIRIPQGSMFYLDDRDLHMMEITKKFPELRFLHLWKTFSSFDEASQYISRYKDNGTPRQSLSASE
ncbi:MAG: magnesium-dependent phosphatase-1 [Candidatus Thermoplasmatota archaeon]|nr:magnesium-dependent phosphatase-1 [Candidatus Thermoplasmatota archaeon]